MNAVTTKFVHTSTNKNRCPVNVIRVRHYQNDRAAFLPRAFFSEVSENMELIINL